MRTCMMTMAAVLLTSCGSGDVVAENAVPPTVNELAETPGDWSALRSAVGRTPGDSDLLKNSPISVDLNATLGPQVDAFRTAMSDAGPLQPEQGVLVSRSRSGGAYLVIQAADHSFEAGVREGGEWKTFQTPGAEVPRPASVQRLRGG